MDGDLDWTNLGAGVGIISASISSRTSAVSRATGGLAEDPAATIPSLDLMDALDIPSADLSKPNELPGEILSISRMTLDMPVAVSVTLSGRGTAPSSIRFRPARLRKKYSPSPVSGPGLTLTKEVQATRQAYRASASLSGPVILGQPVPKRQQGIHVHVRLASEDYARPGTRPIARIRDPDG